MNNPQRVYPIHMKILMDSWHPLRKCYRRQGITNKCILNLHYRDGIVLCNVYNNIVKRSRRPFGFINKVHKDTKRTYRAIENLRFFAA